MLREVAEPLSYIVIEQIFLFLDLEGIFLGLYKGEKKQN